MQKREIVEYNDNLPTTLNLGTIVAILKMQFLSLFRRSHEQAKRVKHVQVKRRRIVSPRLAIVTTGTAVLLASFALRMELLSVASALVIWFAMQETEGERKEREAEEMVQRHAEKYGDELAKELARREAAARFHQGNTTAQYAYAHRAQSEAEARVYH